VFVLVLTVVAVVVAILEVAALWRIFTKADRAGWKALIPLYNLVILLEIVDRPWWWLFLWLIPGVSGIVFIVVCVELADLFGRNGWFGVGLIVLTPVFAPILGFGSSRYRESKAPAHAFAYAS
jgi:hypothetical protein